MAKKRVIRSIDLSALKTVERVTHYPDTDPECGSDYYDVELIDRATGKQIVAYGDAYHDRGSEKMDGFLDALTKQNADLEIIHSDVADRNE